MNRASVADAPTVFVRAMTASDLDAVGGVHREAFPEYLLTRMGRGYLRHFYGQFLTGARHYALVAQFDGRIAGFVAGTAESERFYEGVHRTRRFSTAAGVVARALVDPAFRKQILARRTHLARAFAAFTGRAAPAPKRQEDVRASAAATRLLSIGVAPWAQRRGVAQALVEAFCARLHRDGIELVGLSVLHDNAAAIAFYERTGWEREFADERGVYYVRHTHAG